MSLTKEEQIELILMAGSGSYSKVAEDFNCKFDKNITEHTVVELINKFRETGSVEDQTRSGATGTYSDDVQENEDLPLSTPEDPPLSVQEGGVSSVEPFQTSNDLEQVTSQVLHIEIYFGEQFDEHVLHHGKSSVLLRGQINDGTAVVIKKRPVSEISSSRLEAEILCELKHPGLVGFKYYKEDYEFTYLVLDPVELLLEEHIEQINAQLTKEHKKKAALKTLTVEVLQVLSVLHQKRYVHGDVKQRNVRVDKGQPKLIDFTTSEKVTADDDQKIKDEIRKAGVLAYYILSGGENYCGLNSEFTVSELEWDFVEGMTKNRQRLKKALDHPVFWTDYRRLKYLEALGNLKLQVNEKLREKTYFKTYENWKSKLPDSKLLMEMERERAKRTTSGAAEGEATPYPDDLLGLLRFIRNLLQHRPEKKTDFLFRVFPDLFQGVYILARDIKWNSKPSVKKVLLDW